MVRKRKPLNSVDGNRSLTAAADAVARGKSLRRTTTNDIMDHQDDDAYDFLSASSSVSSSRSLKRAKHSGGTSTSSAAVHHQHHHNATSAKYAGNNGTSTTTDTDIMVGSDTKTPRISNLSAAEQKARVAAWVLPPRTPKPSHLTTMVVMSATTNANTKTNAKTTTKRHSTLNPLPKLRRSKLDPQPSLPQQRAERARERASPGTSRIPASHRAPSPPPPVLPPPAPAPALSKAPSFASNAAHAAPRIVENLLRNDTSDEPQPQQQQQPKLNSQPSLLQNKDTAIDNDTDNNNNNAEDDNDDMDLDSDNDSLGISGGGVTATVREDSTTPVTEVPEDSTTPVTDTAITTATLSITDPTKDEEWVLKAPSSVEREAVVCTEILQPASGQRKLVPISNDYRAIDAAAAVVAHDAKQKVPTPPYPAKKPRWLRQSTTPGKQPFSSSGADDGAPVAAAAAVACTQSLATKTPCSNASSQKQPSPLLLKVSELARQRESLKKERGVHSPSVLELIQAPPVADAQVRLVAPRSAIRQRIDELLQTPKTHSPSVLENIGDPSSQLVRPLSRNVMEKYRRSSADNEEVLQAMLQSGTRNFRTPDSPIRDTLALIGTTVKLERCDSLDGSEMTMEDLQHKMRPHVRAPVLEREQQTARSEARLDDMNPITEETMQVQVQSPEVQGDEEEQLEVESTKVESLKSKSLRDYSPELWTAEAAGHTNHAHIFELRGGVLYRHPPMAPGWSLGVSKSKNKPYYYHPDFGTSFFCPVPLPSANEAHVGAKRVTQRREQSIGTLFNSRVEIGRSPETESFETAVTSTSRGDSHGATPALQSGFTATAFYSPDTIGISARKLFAIPSGSEKLGTDADNASASTGESVLGTQVSPRGVDAFSSSGHDSETSPTIDLQETAVTEGKHARRQDGNELLATDEDSASRSTATTAGECAVGTKATTSEAFSEVISMVEIEETVATVKRARSRESVVLAAQSLQGSMKEQHKNVQVIGNDGKSAVGTKAPTPQPFSQELAMAEIEETVATVKHARCQESVVLAANSLQVSMKEQRENAKVIRNRSSAEPCTRKRNLAAGVEYNSLRTEQQLGVGLSSTPHSEMLESSVGPPDVLDREQDDELIGVVVRTPVDTITAGGSPLPENFNDSLVDSDNEETPEPFSEALAMVEIEETVATVKHSRCQESVVLAAHSLQGTMKNQHKNVRVIWKDSSAEPSTGKRNLAAEVEYNSLRAEQRLGVGFSSTPHSEMLESSAGPPDVLDHEQEDELIGVAVRTPVDTITAGGSPLPENDNDSIVGSDNEESPPFPSGDQSTPMSHVCVNNEDSPSPSAEGLSPMAGKSVRPGVGDESPAFPNDVRPSPTSRKCDRSGGGYESPPFPADDGPSPTSGKSSISTGDESPAFPADDGPSPTSGKSGISAGEESPPFPTNDGPSPNEIQYAYASANNLTPHLDAQVRKPSSTFSPVFSRVDSFDRVSDLDDDAMSLRGMTRRKDLANLSRVISHAKPLEDEVSALNNDGMSYVDTGDYSYESRSRHSKDSKGSSLVSRMSHRVRYPPMPLCILQNLESLPFAKKKDKRKAKKKSKKQSKKQSIPPRDVLDSLGSS
jgi:hypothetical protein